MGEGASWGAASSATEVRLIAEGSLGEAVVTMAKGPAGGTRGDLLEAALVASMIAASRPLGGWSGSGDPPVAAAMEVLETVVDQSDTGIGGVGPDERARVRARRVTHSALLPPGFTLCARGDPGAEALREKVEEASRSGDVAGLHVEAADVLQHALDAVLEGTPVLDRSGVLAVAFAEVGFGSASVRALSRLAQQLAASLPEDEAMQGPGRDAEFWSTLGSEGAEASWGLPAGCMAALHKQHVDALVSLTMAVDTDSPGQDDARLVESVMGAAPNVRLGLLTDEARRRGLYHPLAGET